MKKQYINAFIIVLIIVLATNTDFYKKNILGIDTDKIAAEKAQKESEPKKEKSLEDADEESSEDSDVVTEESIVDSNIVSPVLDSTLDSAALDSIAKLPVLTERKITVNGNNLSLTFSSKGAVIESVNLNKFYDNDKKVLTLFNSGSINTVKVNKFLDKETLYVLNTKDSVKTITSKDSISFTYEGVNTKITKTYVIDPDSYSVVAKLAIDNKKEIVSYAVNWDSPIIFNDREDKNHNSIVSLINDEYEENNDEELVYNFSNVKNFWVGYRIKYFWGSMIFDNTSDLEGKIYSKSKMNEPKDAVKGYFHTKFTPSTDEKKIDVSYQILFSPVDEKVLVDYGYNLERVAKFGWSLIQPVSGLVMTILLFLNKFISNWGIIIIIFSLLLKSILYPLNKKTIQSSKKMQDIQPLVKELNKKYAKDPQRKQMELMNLYKEHKVNPFGSCLPMLVQMPIFFAMYAVFRGAIEFRQAPFFGWITDLSQPESLITPIKIAMFGGFEFHLGILVFISSIAMFLQMKMTMKDPKQAMMPYMMGIMMFFIFSNMSSGLNLYWATFNMFQLVQQIIIEKKS